MTFAKDAIISGREARKYEFRTKDEERDALFGSRILREVRPGKAVRVCDFCCGPGNNIELLRGKVGEIFGVDLSEEMIRICREKFGKDKSIKLKVASVTDTGLESGYFDFIIIRMGLHHVRNKKKVLAEACRLLKPRGRLVIIDKHYLSLFELYRKAFRKLIFQGNPALFREHMISEKEHTDLFSLFKQFKTIRKELFPYDEKHTGQSFLCVLEKT